jgi:hypothetical protein
LSGRVSRLLLEGGPVPLKLNLTPGTTAEQWRERAAAWQRERGRKTIRNLLDECLPRSLAEAACREAGIPPDLTASRLPGPLRDRLVDWITALPLTITGADGGMEQAMVTSGGVSLKHINPATLESRRVRGLYFAGEVLDLDGPCGGFNLQWAFSSGWLAGQSAASGQ